MKIALKNHTLYEDDDLRALLRHALQQVGLRMSGHRSLRKTTLNVHYSKGKLTSGRATIGPERGSDRWLVHGVMTLRIPKPPVEPNLYQEFLADVARVTVHEALHFAGVRHADMTENQRYCRGPVPAFCFFKWTLRVKQPKPPVEKMAAYEDKLKHAERMLARALTRAKRANTIHKKWLRRYAMLRRRGTKPEDGAA